MSTTLNTNPGAYNNEPGSDLFHTMVFGNVDNADIPNNVEDPFISYNEDAKEYEQFVVESDKRYSALMRKLNQLNRNQYMTRTLAMECASVMPKFLEKRRIESFTMTPSRTNYHYACESVHWAVWGLVAAGMAALVALCWKLYRVITDTGSSDSGGGGSSSGSGPLSEAEATKAAEKTSKKAEETLQKREARSKTFGEVRKQLDDIIAHQDGVMKITAANTSDEIFKELDSSFKKEDGITVDYAFVNALLKAMYPTEGTHEYNLINGVQGNNAMRVIFHDLSVGDKAKQEIATCQELFQQVFSEIETLFTTVKDINNANLTDLEGATHHAQQILNNISRLVTKDPDSGANKSRLMMALDSLRVLLQKEGTMPTARTPQDIQKILDTVSKDDGNYISLFKMLEDTVHIGPDSLTAKLGKAIPKLEDLSKTMQQRLDKRADPSRDMTTKDGQDNMTRDRHAEFMKTYIDNIRAAMADAQKLLSVSKVFTTEVLALDKLIGKVVVELLKKLAAIYKDNGKQTNKFVELANNVSGGLGFGNKVFS